LSNDKQKQLYETTKTPKDLRIRRGYTYKNRLVRSLRKDMRKKKM